MVFAEATKPLASWAVGDSPHDNDQRHLELHYRSELVRDVPDSTVVRDRDPSVPAAMLEPLLVTAVRREQVNVAFDGQSGLGEDGRKLLAEISIGEVGPSHAARE